MKEILADLCLWRSSRLLDLSRRWRRRAEWLEPNILNARAVAVHELFRAHRREREAM